MWSLGWASRKEKRHKMEKKMKVFKTKIVPAPWRGEGAEDLRVDLEDALRSFPNSSKEQGFIDSQGVFIGARDHNMPTYVLVESPECRDAEHSTWFQPWTLGDRKVELWSVNGAGECRWKVRPTSWLERADKQAVEAFGVKK